MPAPSTTRARSTRNRLAACLAGGLLWLAGCGDDNGPPFGVPPTGPSGGGTTPGAVAVSLTGSPLTLVQGQSGTAAVTVARTGSFTGAVALTLEGAPAGVAATFAPASVAAGATASTVTVAAAATAAPGTYATTVRATGTGVTDATTPLSVVVTAAPVPAFAFTLNPTAVSVVQGASATTSATITRSGGFTGPLAFTVSGLPTGVTATVDPASATGNSATITITAAASAAPGTATLTVQGAGTGVANQTATVALTVTAAPTQGTTSTYAFCADDAPVWFAVQDGTGPWTTVAAGANNSFNFRVNAARGGIAYVTRSATSGTSLTVLYASASELAGTGGSNTTNVACTVGTKTVNGSVASVGPSETSTITLGSSSATVLGAGGANTFQLRNVSSGPHDLIASRAAQVISGSDISFNVNRLIVRRGLDPADGSTLPVLDFGASEAFEPATANATINNLGGDRAITSVSLSTANGGSAAFYFATGAAASAPYYGLPDARLASGDLHSLFVGATPAAETGTVRSATLYFRSVTARTVTLGPALAAPTITSAATAPYLQLRAQLAQQGEYNRLGGVFYSQGSNAAARGVSVLMTAGYAGSGAFDLLVPNLSTATGFDNNWGLQPGVSTTWNVFESGGTLSLGLPGQLPAEGATVLSASRSGTLASP